MVDPSGGWLIFESKWMDYGFFDCLEFGKNMSCQEQVVA